MSEDSIIQQVRESLIDFKEWIKDSIRRLGNDVDALERDNKNHESRIATLEADHKSHNDWIKTIEDRVDSKISGEREATTTREPPKDDVKLGLWSNLFSARVLPWVIVIILIIFLILVLTDNVRAAIGVPDGH